MSNKFDVPNSANAAALQNMLGEQNVLDDPISRNAKILHNILGEHHDVEQPVGKIGKLLLQLEDVMPSGEIEITENGEHDVTAYETATVNVSGGGGISGGHIVTFKVENDDYYIASCEAGNKISSPPAPTPATDIFNGWETEENELIAFPYEPEDDITLNAIIKEYNFLAQPNQNICTLNGNTFVWAGSDEVAICSYCKNKKSYSNAKTYAFAIHKTAGGTVRGSDTVQSFTYNNETWYVTYSSVSSNYTDTSGLNRFVPDNFTANNFDVVDVAKETLDAYFGVTVNS